MVDFLEDLKKFLNFLTEKRKYPKERTIQKLGEVFGKRNFDDLDNFCFAESFIGSEEINRKGVAKENIARKINHKGLKFLWDLKMEEDRSMKIEEYNKITNFLTTILVITTIASFFRELETINPITLTLTYGIFAILIWIYFKYSKNIKL